MPRIRFSIAFSSSKADFLLHVFYSFNIKRNSVWYHRSIKNQLESVLTIQNCLFNKIGNQFLWVWAKSVLVCIYILCLRVYACLKAFIAFYVHNKKSVLLWKHFMLIIKILCFCVSMFVSESILW